MTVESSVNITVFLGKAGPSAAAAAAAGSITSTLYLIFQKRL